MERLPREITDKICRFLHKDDLKNVLTLTEKFRYAAEQYSGAFATYTIDETNAEKFVALYSGYRLLYLHDVVYRPTLPQVVWDDRSCRDTVDELRERDEAFTRQIKILFSTLKFVEVQAGPSIAPGRYRLSIYSPTIIIDDKFWIMCLHHHYVSWRVHLLNPTELPQIASVRSLEVVNKRRREWPEWEAEFKLDLRIIVDLAIKFPHLEYYCIKTGGFEWHIKYAEGDPQTEYEHDWEGPRRDARHDFAHAVDTCQDQLPVTLEQATLDFLNPLQDSVEIHHAQRLPNLVSPAKKDPFSASLGILSRNLRQLRLRAVMDESLFWPDKGGKSFGPNLEILEVMFHVACPDGRWFFHGPGTENHDVDGFEINDDCYPPFETTDSDKQLDSLRDATWAVCKNWCNSCFRITPHQANLRPFLEGFARAATGMKYLKKCLIWTPLAWGPTESDPNYGSDPDYGSDFETENEGIYDYLPGSSELVWGIAYYEPGSRSKSSFGDFNSRQLRWMVGQWRPDAQLHELFREIGYSKHGGLSQDLWPEDLRQNSTIAYRDGRFTDFMFTRDPGSISCLT